MYKKFVKRLLDIIIGIAALPFVLVAIIVIGPLIYFEDRGYIFYTSQRKGLYGKVFSMYKLRSMKMNAPDIRNADNSTYNAPDDQRVTKIGGFIRKTSLDELPQVFNIIKGDMSFVGPRPTLATKLYDEIDIEMRKRHEVRPGLTGYTQAYFRNSISPEEKNKWDLYYVDHESFLLDLKIVIKTVGTVLRQENIFIAAGKS